MKVHFGVLTGGCAALIITGFEGWVDRYAGFCFSLPLPAGKWRPSIYERRYRRPPAAYPDTQASSLQTRPVWPCSGWGLPSRTGHPARWWSLTPPFHPYCAAYFYATQRSVFCGTFLRVTPSGRYPPPCSAEPGRSSANRCPCRSTSVGSTRPPGQPIRDRFYRGDWVKWCGANSAASVRR